MATMEDVYRALVKADAAGDVESARALARYIREQQGIPAPAEPERTIGGYAKEAVKGLIPGLVGLGETAITGAAALLPEEAEQAVRRPVEEFAAGVREKFAPAPGYEDTLVREVSEGVGSTLPFLGLGVLGAAGRVAATGLGVSTGAGEARQRAEAEEATEGERGAATALGTIPGAFESLGPIRILRRFGFGDDAVKEVAGFVPALRRVAQAGGEEALQEASSQVLQNLIAKGVYKPEEAVLGGVSEAATVGGGAGAVIGAIAELALGRRLRGVEPPPERREEEAPPAAPTAPAAAAPAVEEEPAGRISPREEIERRARELRFLAMQDERLREAVEKQERDEASKDDLEYLAQYDAALRARDAARRRPLGEEDQIGLPLVGGEAQLDLLAPTEAGEAIPGMYRPAEDALAGLRPRSRAYKEEAKDLGLKLDKKGNLKPNQFVPEITAQVSPDQERFEFEEQKQLPLTQPAPFEGQGDLFAQEPIPPGPTVPFTRQEPTVEVPTTEVPEGQFALNLPGIPMERLTPRDRVLRAMAITEDKKNIPNLRFATGLRPMELQKTLGDLKNEGAINFSKQANEWELTPAGAERVRSGSETKPPRPRRRVVVPVQPSGAKTPAAARVRKRGMAGAGAAPAQSDVGEGAGELALTKPDRISERIIFSNAGSDFVKDLYSANPVDAILTNFEDLNTVTPEEINQSREYIRDISQNALRNEFGDEVTLYRGLKGTEERSPVLSYTLDKNVAKFQAEQQGIRTGKIEEIKVPVSKVLSYSEAIGRGTFAEAEVIISNPAYRMEAIRRAQEQRVARSAINEVEGRRSALRTQAIDAFDADEISEKTYTAVTEQLKKPVPNFALVTSMLEGKAKPKREKDVGLKFQRVPKVKYKDEGASYEQGLEFYYKGRKFSLSPKAGMFSRPLLNVFGRNNERVGDYYANNERGQVDSRVDDASQIDQYNLPPDITNAIKSYLFSYSKGDAAVSAAGKRVADVVNAEIAKYETAPKTQRGEVGAGLPIDRVQAVANDAISTWANPPKVVVASNVNDPAIPEDFRDQIPEDAPGFYANGTTYVLADRAKDEASVRGTVFHESLGHYGLEQQFQDGLQDVMQRIYNTNPKMRDAANTRMEKFGLDAPTAVEEVLAERSEEGPIKESWLRGAFNQVTAYIRNFLRQRGLVSKYSDNDVNQILRQAHRRVTDLRKAPYDPFNPAIRYQRSPEAQRRGDRAFVNAVGKIPQNLPVATKETLDTAKNVASNLPSATRRALYSLYDPHEMGRIYSKDLKSNALEKLWRNANQEGVELRKMQEVIMDNMTKWNKVMEKYSNAEQERIFNLFMDTTVTKIQLPVTDAKGKTKLKEVTGVEVLNLVDPSRNVNWKADDHPLAKQFARLDKPVQDFYKELRLSYVDNALAVEKQLQKYLTPTEWQKVLSKLNEQRIRVYLPLFREGKFKLSYTDKSGNPVALQFETSRERDIAEKELLREGIDRNSINTSRVEDREVQNIPPSSFLADIVADLTKAKVNNDTITAVIEHYLDYLPAESVLQRGRRRGGVAGYSKDVLKAYANVSDSYARRIVKMEFTPKYQELQEEFKKAVLSARDRGDIAKDVAEDLDNYVAKYIEFTRNPNLDNWGAKLGYTSFQLYLGANISTAVTNVIDTPTVMLSRLLGRGHSIGNVSSALMKASSTFFKKQKSPEMQELLQRGLDSGIIREQRLQDIAEFKNLSSRWEKLKANVDRISSWAFAKSDIFNRQVGLIAAYELEKAKNKTPPNVFDVKAFQAAENVVADVYGSSFPKATAPIMGSDIAKTALTFKRFGIKRINLLQAAYKEATRDLDPNDPDSKIIRDAARKEIIGYFATSFVSAGVQGMPVVGAAMILVTVLNAILGDDDEPYDADFELREAVGLFAYKGPINYLLGIDIASRTGWTGMFWREDPKRMAEVGPVTYAVEQALGPAYAYAVGVPKAFDYISDGNYQRAFEQLMPRAISNVSKGFRYGTDGALTAQGVPLVEDVSAYNTFMQLFGFRPSDVAEAGDIAGASKRMESKIFQRRNAIIARAAVAQISGDTEGFQEAVQEALEFSRKYPALGITPETVYDAVQRRSKKLLMSVNGVTVNPKVARDIYEELGVTEEVE